MKVAMTIQELQKVIIDYRDARDWKQFHNPKDLAISLNLEAAEVLEFFQRKNNGELETHIQNNKEQLSEELIDTLYRILLMAHDLDIDLIDAFHKKMKKNTLKYPVEKAKGSSKKYTEL